MPAFQIELHLSADQLLRYYQGTVRHVVARTSTGQVVQFPVAHLKKFVTHEGVHGLFMLTCDPNHKLISLERATGSN